MASRHGPRASAAAPCEKRWLSGRSWGNEDVTAGCEGGWRGCGSGSGACGGGSRGCEGGSGVGCPPSDLTPDRLSGSPRKKKNMSQESLAGTT
jgi:hypothetical protein